MSEAAETASTEAQEPLVWRALADPNRRRLLDLLTARPHNTGQLAAQFDISRIAVMKHLDVLVDAGLVLSRKRGRERWHHVNPAPLLGLHERWTTPLSAGLARGLLNLKDITEDTVSAEVTTLEIEIEQDIAASPERVFAAIVDTGKWWGPPFSKPNATGMRIDPTLGGWFVEVLEGGELGMARIEGVVPDRWLLMRGGFHLGAADCTTEITLTPAPPADADADTDATTVAMSFRAHGLIDEAMKDGFRGGWHELITVRLKSFVEDGTVLGVDAG